MMEILRESTDIIPKVEPNFNWNSCSNDFCKIAQIETVSDSSVHQDYILDASPPKQLKDISRSNPYVLIRRLTNEELEVALNTNISSNDFQHPINSRSPLPTILRQHPSNAEALNVSVGNQEQSLQISPTMPKVNSNYAHELESINTTSWQEINNQVPGDVQNVKFEIGIDTIDPQESQELEDRKFIVMSLLARLVGPHSKTRRRNTSKKQGKEMSLMNSRSKPKQTRKSKPKNSNPKQTSKSRRKTSNTQSNNPKSPKAKLKPNSILYAAMEGEDESYYHSLSSSEWLKSQPNNPIQSSDVNSTQPRNLVLLDPDLTYESTANKCTSHNKKAENDVCYGKRKRTTRFVGYKNVFNDSESDVFVISSEDDNDDSDEDYEYYEESNLTSKLRSTSKQENRGSVLRSAYKPETKSKSKKQNSKTKSKPKRDSTLELVTNPKLKSNDILATTTLEEEDEGYFHSLSLIEWLKTQTKDQSQIFDSNVTLPRNLVLLDPDLTSDSTPLKASEISVSNPVICRLCLFKLVSELEVRNHAENCWLHNERNHVFCLKCGTYFVNHENLNSHNKACHREEYQQDQSQNPNARAKTLQNSVSCIICCKIFPNLYFFKLHKQSLTIFKKRINEIENGHEEKKDEDDIHVFYKCKICKQEFFDENTFLLHKNSHDDDDVDLICLN